MLVTLSTHQSHHVMPSVHQRDSAFSQCEYPISRLFCTFSYS